ncbi:MAG: right-handed parallel beta-helix repeat-containing protein [Xanthomonadales bacterium]|nr:right-handed parallel beta-helix repeat-containing protein [Xanthomonadales bacterium]
MRSALATITVLAAALSFGARAEAAALQCGDVIDQDVTLTADLHCASGESALTVTRSGIRIDLNGHTLSGVANMDGIDVIGARDVSIVGPGRIEGFRAGIYAVRTQRLALSAIEFDNLDTGALLIHSGSVDLRDSRFSDIGGIAVNVMQPQLGPMNNAGGHLLLDNQFANVGSGIQLCGVDTGHALIQRNRFEQVRDFGIHLADGSSGNRIEDNRFDGVSQTAIELQASSRNRITGNRIADGRFGVSMSPRSGGFCETGGGLPTVFANDIDGNEFAGLERGVRAGVGARAEGPAWHNAITDNGFNGNEGDVILLGDSGDTLIDGNRWDAGGERIEDYSYRAGYYRANYGYYSR